MVKGQSLLWMIICPRIMCKYDSFKPALESGAHIVTVTSVLLIKMCQYLGY